MTSCTVDGYEVMTSDTTEPTTFYVDFTYGNDSNSGSATSPWLTLQQAYDTVSTTDPINLSVTGGTDNDDSSPISALPNVSLIAGTNVVLNQAFVIGGTSSFSQPIFVRNINFNSTVTWPIVDTTTPSLQFSNCYFGDVVTLTQTGGGTVSPTFFNCNFSNGFEIGGYLTVNIFDCILAGNATFDDNLDGIITITGGRSNASMSVSGRNAFITGGFLTPDILGGSFTFVTTLNGAPLVLPDCAGLTSTYTGSPEIYFNSYSQYVSYSPANPGDWAGTAPAVVKDALDRMASLLHTIHGAPIP